MFLQPNFYMAFVTFEAFPPLLNVSATSEMHMFATSKSS